MNFSTFHQALDYLYSFISFEHKTSWQYNARTLNLESFRGLLKELGSPQFSFKSIHVAGSDGKGSVCAMIESVLQVMGYQVGMYISPHLEDIRERITINQQWIPEADFIRLAEHLRQVHEKFPLNSFGYATFFELITAMGFLHFQQRGVDFAVIETGLGGRLDATNVMDPVVTVITHISLEHTERLGNTLEQIADEKLGIIRPGTPVIIAPQEPDARRHIKLRLQKHPAKVVFVDEEYFLKSASQKDNFQTLTYLRNSVPNQPHTVNLSLLGSYQHQNALTAIAALDTLHEAGYLENYGMAQLCRGLQQTSWAGRFEFIQKRDGRKIILDVTHTAQGAIALRKALDETFPDLNRIFITGFLKEKKIKDILLALIRSEDKLILTQAPSPRGCSIEDILFEIHDTPLRSRIIDQFVNPHQAFKAALSHAQPEDLIIITGSLYLAGELRKDIIDVD
ncbi:MAG: bifunctional folylpolyglutamate synthase/dihydrofolate synthase [bacterium]|jgi:dihydrofolate synthase/folylpolyglutamate synthase